MRELIPILIILACPLMMIFMMRGMHGSGHDMTGTQDPQDRQQHREGQADVRSQERIAELEREVARLKDAHAPDFDRWEKGN